MSLFSIQDAAWLYETDFMKLSWGKGAEIFPKQPINITNWDLEVARLGDLLKRDIECIVSQRW